MTPDAPPPPTRIERNPTIRRSRSQQKPDPRWAVVVIGGGPAGMMAAISAAATLREQGSEGKVLLLEKNERPGRKLLITGNGRCNLMNLGHAESPERELMTIRTFCEKYGKKGRFLISAMTDLTALKTKAFFEDRGLELKTGAGGRTFPRSDRAADVLNVLTRTLYEYGVTVETNARVDGFVMRKGNDAVEKLVEADEGKEKLVEGDGGKENLVGETEGKENEGPEESESGRNQETNSIAAVKIDQLGKHWEIRAGSVILCTGGRSYPSTGSSGDGYSFAEGCGHTIAPLRPGLVSLVTGEDMIRDLQGVSMGGVRVTVFRKDRKLATSRGEIMFTHEGLGGPAIMNLSRELGANGVFDDEVGGRSGSLTLRMDLLPELDHQTLDRKLQHNFMAYGDRMAGNCLEGFVPRKVAHIFVKLAGVENRWKINTITREQRLSLIKLLKEFELTVTGHGGWDRAMITVGGVSLKEIDPRTMRSKLVENLFIAGEIIDIDGPSGGYNLQVCWSTGHLAGKNAVTVK